MSVLTFSLSGRIGWREKRPAGDPRTAGNDIAGATDTPLDRGSDAPPDAPAVRKANLLFGYYPLRLARELIGWDVGPMAARFGRSRSDWLKLEANLLVMPPEMAGGVESFVQEELASMCGH